MSRRAMVCGGAGLFLTSMMAFGHWIQPSLPAPGEDAIVATVGCDLTSIREAVAVVPGGSALRLGGEIFTEGGIFLGKDLFTTGAGEVDTDDEEG